MNEKIREILDGFRHYNGVYRRDLVDAAIELREEITPHLIAVLEAVLSNPAEYIENPDYFDHLYAVMLLGHFGEAKAHRIIIDVFSSADVIENDLFGDTVTEDLPMILLRTCNGSLEHIKAMALDKSADDYCRGSALHAMAFGVMAGIVNREEVLTFYGSLFSGQEADEGSDLWSLLASSVCRLYPEELMETISRAYEEGLINPGFIGYSSFERALRRGKDEQLGELEKEFERSSLDDLHSRMSWWACFNPQPKGPLPGGQNPSDSAGTISNSSLKQKKAKKKKRKMSKASKKKNRR